MPIIQIISEKIISLQAKIIEEIKVKCKNSKSEYLKGKKIEKIFIYSICEEFEDDDGPAMIAVAEFKNDIYAIHQPGYLKDLQFKVIRYFFSEIPDNSKVVVFSDFMMEKASKYLHGCNITIVRS